DWVQCLVQFFIPRHRASVRSVPQKRLSQALPLSAWRGCEALSSGQPPSGVSAPKHCHLRSFHGPFRTSLSCIAPVLWLVSTACTAPRASDEQRPEPSSAPVVAPQRDGENEVGAKNAQVAPTRAQPQAASAPPADHKTEQ